MAYSSPSPCRRSPVRAAILLAFSFLILSADSAYCGPSYKSKSEGILVKKELSRPDGGAPFNIDFSGEGEIDLKNGRERLKGQDEVTFYQFRLRPWVERSRSADMPTVEVEGAVIGFRYDETAQASELLVATGSDRTRGFEWYSSGAYLAHNEDGSVAGHLPVMLRVDRAAGVWDLYLYNRMRLADLPLLEGQGKFRLKTVGKGDTSIASLRIGDDNPLFEDEDLDGIEDSFSKRYPGKGRGDALEGTGSTLLVEYLSRKPEAFHRKKAAEAGKQ